MRLGLGLGLGCLLLAGCRHLTLAPPPAGPEPGATVLDQLGSALQRRDLPALVRLFDAECRSRCRGFVPLIVRKGGGYEAAVWVPRPGRGELLADLVRILASYHHLEARAVPLRMQGYAGRIRLRARLDLSGVDAEGYVRTDEGLVDLDLREGPTGWRIHDLRPGGVRTLRRDEPGFGRPRTIAGLGPGGRKVAETIALPGRESLPPWAALDANGDGVTDLVTVRAGQLLLLEGRTDGALAAPRPLGRARNARVLRAGDLNGDGRTDLFVGSYGDASQLWLNRQAGLEPLPGFSLRGHVTDAVIANLAGDGTPDLYVVRHGPPGRPPWQSGEPNQLFVGGRAGLTRSAAAADAGWGLAACAADLDGDGRTDLFVANALGPSRLYLSQGGGRLEERGRSAGLDGLTMATACAVGDVDGDGDLDLLVGGRRPRQGYLFERRDLRAPGDGLIATGRARHALSRAAAGDLLLVNVSRRGRPAFRVVALEDLGWTVSAGIVDHDADGLLDLLLLKRGPAPAVERQWWWRVMGAILRRRPVPKLRGVLVDQPGRLWVNLGRPRHRWVDGGAVAWNGGLAGSAALVQDLDGDGRLDLLLDGTRPPATARWTGEGETGHAALLRLAARPPNVNAVGCRVEILAGGRRQVREVGGASGLMVAPPGHLHAGVGEALRLESVRVRWPDGRWQRFVDLPVDRPVVLQQGGHASWSREPISPEEQPAPPEPPAPLRLLELAVEGDTLAAHAGERGTALLIFDEASAVAAETLCDQLARLVTPRAGLRALAVTVGDGPGKLRCGLPTFKATAASRGAVGQLRGLLPLVALVDAAGDTRRLISGPTSDAELRAAIEALAPAAR